MQHPRSLLPALALVAWMAPAAGRCADESGIEFFEKQIRPILAARCYECHSGRIAKPKGNLRLDSLAATLKGGETGPAIVPGKPKESLLVDAINYGDVYQMPPKGKLPVEEIAALTKWIDLGAPWPDEKTPSTAAVTGIEFDLAKRKAEHWCWQPIKAQTLPAVKNESWIKDPLDRFILRRLEGQGVDPAPPAERRTLIRRAYFDLIGLPPRPDEAQSHEPFEVIVDRLLASPRFGERWARHWLDLVRYAESRGHEFDYDTPNAFEYRDYVIRALNADVPYDQFAIEHIAGDLLKQPRLHPSENFNESIIGTGFWFLGEWCHSPVDARKDECDRIDNMLDVFSKTFLGVTVACARCHDHKFDAISQEDYYALAGYLQSSSYRLARFETWQQDKRAAANLSALDAHYRPLMAKAVAAAIAPKIDEFAKALAAADPEKLKEEIGVLESDLKGAELVVDYSNLPAGAWMANGPTFGDGPVSAGQLVLTGEPAQPLEVAPYGAARREWAWGDLGIAKGSENDPARLGGWVRAGRTLKTPTFVVTSGQVHYLIEGVGQVYAAVDSHFMNNGPLHGELIKDTGGNSDLPLRWITHDLSRYIGHRLHLEFTPKEGEDFRLLMVVQGPRPAAPKNRASRLPAASAAEWAKVAGLTLDLLAANRIAADEHPPDRAALANWLIAQFGFDEHASPDLQRLVSEYRTQREKLETEVRADSRLCLAMWDGTSVDEQVLIRGNHKTIGPVVQRRLLAAMQESGAKSQESSAGGSGRLELARRLADPRNPLVSRVIVNRVWQHLMGRGIVSSVDNFGVLGQPPTHPELLDYLADAFVRDGWSLKRLVRHIVLSSTYQQESGARSQESETIDPQNSLFHRQNLKRLEGEALRDAILAVSGRIDYSMHGPSVPVYLTPFMQGRGRPKESGPLDGDGRRSVHLAVRRNFLSPMMLAFDTPIPFTTIGRRNVSNVPAQALILMNDPFVAEQARLWARVIVRDAASPALRVRQMYLAAFGRQPTAVEATAALAFVERQAREYGASADDSQADERPWTDLAHVLFNAKEFLFVD